MAVSDMLGTGKVNKLIFQLGWPAALNFLVISVYNITDAIFAGRWLGAMPIAAVVIVGGMSFLFSSYGLTVGFGGSSIISRALGEKNKEKAAFVFGNQVILFICFSVLVVATGLIFQDFLLTSFGAYGDILKPARAYYRVVLFGVPFLAFGIMGSLVLQALGKAKAAMVNSLIPTALKILLSPVFIKGFNMGIEGAAFATLAGYILGFFLVLRFFMSPTSEIPFSYKYLRFKPALVREILMIGGSVVINLLVTNVLTIILNRILFKYEQESGVVIYSIINRVSMLLLIPVFAIDSGTRPIIGYNFGSQQVNRIRNAVHLAIKYGLVICYVLLAIVIFSASYWIRLFTSDQHVIDVTPFSMQIVFSFSPLFIIEIITVAYFQSIGKSRMALGLTFFRNIVLMLPALYILPRFFGYYGVLYAFPVVDILTTIVVFWLLRNELNTRLEKRMYITAGQPVNSIAF